MQRGRRAPPLLLLLLLVLPLLFVLVSYSVQGFERSELLMPCAEAGEWEGRGAFHAVKGGHMGEMIRDDYRVCHTRNSSATKQVHTGRTTGQPTGDRHQHVSTRSQRKGAGMTTP